MNARIGHVMDRIVLDQSKIRVHAKLPIKPGSQFPRSIEWWQRYVPLWLDISIDEVGHVVLKANGRRADGAVLEVTPALSRRRLRAARQWMASRIHFDFSESVIDD